MPDKPQPKWGLLGENYKLQVWLEASVVIILTAISSYFIISYNDVPKWAWCELVSLVGMPWAGLWFISGLWRIIRAEGRHVEY